MARGEHWSDSYDNETDPDGDATNNAVDIYGSVGNNGSSIDLLGGKSMLHQVQNARNKVLGKGMALDGDADAILTCPEGYDPVKWAQMTRAQKMKALGISEKEWNKMTREQQMKRMNKMAHGFHFYAMNKP